jgi:hypothetical protein
MSDMYVSGYPIITGSETILWSYDGIDYKEIIHPRALDKTDISDFSLLYNHSHDYMLVASVRNGSLKLFRDYRGLKMIAKVADTTAGRDFYYGIKTGLINKMSFAFSVDEDEYNKEKHLRTIKSIKRLYDVSAVDLPAYPQTSIGVASKEEIETFETRYKSDKRRKRLLNKVTKNLMLEQLNEELK